MIDQYKVINTYLSLILILLFSTSLNAQKAEKLWTYKVPGSNIDASVGVGDLDRDGFQDIVAVSTNGEIIALDGYGRIIWKTTLKDKITIAPTLMNVSGDLGLEVLILTHSGKLLCLDGMTGNQIWKNNSLSEIKWGSMSIITTDLDQDGNIEIIAGDLSGKLICLDGNGKIIWEYNEAEGIGSSPAIGDLDGDGKSEIIIASEDTPLICLNHKGKEQWRFNPPKELLELGRKRVVAAPVIYDINGDGTAEIITGVGFQLVTVNKKGEQLWSFPFKNRIDSTIAVADANDDGDIEIYAIDLSGNMVSVSKDGKENWSKNLGFKSRRSPTIADVDGDGIVEILAVGYGNKFLVFEPDGNIKEELLIKSGTNGVATITDLIGNGELCAIIPEISGNIIVYHWKNDLKNPKTIWPEYRANPSRSASITSIINIQQKNQKGIIDITAFRIDQQNLKDNLSELISTQNELTKLIPQLQNSNGLLERVFYLNDSIKKMQEQLEKINHISPIKKRELRDQLAGVKIESYRLLKIARQAVTEDKIVVAYTANPWAPFGGIDEIVEDRTSESKITIEAFQGEFESAALNLFNFSGSARTFRVEVVDFSGSTKTSTALLEEVFTLRETIAVPTQNSDMSSDALPELNSGNLMMVPAWNGRQLWITINTKKLTPGIWKAKIKLKSLEIDPVIVETELNIKIWDEPLPNEQTLKLCHWGNTSHPTDALEDQIAHGTNVFPRTVPVIADFDESGNITNIDYTDHDIFMKSHAPNGILLFHSPVKLNGNSPPFSPTWEKAFKNFIPKWLNHLKELGYGYDNFAFYPADEPGLENGKNVKRFMQWAKLIRKTDPKLLIYANPVAHITMEQLKEIGSYVDIWAPMQTNIFPKEKLDFIHSTKTQWWNYDPSENSKHLSPLGYYRGQAWMSWQYDHTGIGFWTYSQGKGFWFQSNPGYDYAMVYEGKKIVTSKRWEAVRDGVEDFSLLHALKNAMEKAERDGRDRNLIEKATEILTKKAGIIATYNLGENRTHSLKNNEARKIEDMRWLAIQDIRREIAEVLYQFNN